MKLSTLSRKLIESLSRTRRGLLIVNTALLLSLPASLVGMEGLAFKGRSDDRDAVIVHGLREVKVELVDPMQKGADETVYYDGVAVKGNIPHPIALSEKLQKYFRMPLTRAQLDRMRQTVIDFFRDKGYPLTTVDMPRQDITDGDITIEVRIARLGDVRVEGAKWFSSKQIRKTFTSKPGQYIRTPTMLF